MASNNFNAVAPVYDALAGLVFGNTLQRAQRAALPYVPAGARVLMVGGGTGRLLADLCRLNPAGLLITYVEQSDKMMHRAQKRAVGNNEVAFMHTPIEDAAIGTEDFDVVITPFILDCLSEPVLGAVCTKLAKSLKPGGLWLHIDFSLSPLSPWWQHLLMKIMYAFFSITAKIGTSRLFPLNAYFAGFTAVAAHNFMAGFITTQIYRKD